MGLDTAVLSSVLTLEYTILLFLKRRNQPLCHSPLKTPSPLCLQVGFNERRTTNRTLSSKGEYGEQLIGFHQFDHTVGGDHA